MTFEDGVLIHEATILAGVKLPGEILSQSDTDEVVVLLREMRAVTETHRLAVRIAAHFRVQMATADRTLGDPVEGDGIVITRDGKLVGSPDRVEEFRAFCEGRAALLA